MEIIKFKKQKKNIYELELDNGLSFKLYDDVIVKYNLLVNKRLDDKLFEEITTYNDSLGAYYDTLKKLNSKLRSEKELRNLLSKKYSSDIIDKTIERLKKDGYLNRGIYIQSFINDAYRFSNDGPYKIRKKLNDLGFTDEEITPYLELDFSDKIKHIIDKKAKSNNKYSNYMFKNKLNNYLINLGYNKDMFNDYLNSISINNSDILEKEINKLIKKYQNKYQDNDLKIFIKNKLYQKGYSREEVDRLYEKVL